MAGRSLTAENRELAFRVWRECGQNVELTLRTLRKEHEWTVAKPTLYAWMDKFDWKNRSARAEAVEREAEAAAGANEEGRIIAKLEEQKRRYESYFDTLGPGSMDNQAMYAYTNLVKTIVDIRAKVGEYKASLFLDFLTDLVDWLAKNDPEAVIAIEKNFDDFVGHARTKYGG